MSRDAVEETAERLRRLPTETKVLTTALRHSAPWGRIGANPATDRRSRARGSTSPRGQRWPVDPRDRFDEYHTGTEEQPTNQCKWHSRSRPRAQDYLRRSLASIAIASHTFLRIRPVALSMGDEQSLALDVGRKSSLSLRT